MKDPITSFDSPWPERWPPRAAQTRLGEVGRTLSWIAIGWFLAVQLVLIFGYLKGPSIDESIYITAGVRTLEGHGITDAYTTWFPGSLMWPSLAGIGFDLGGIEGARVITAVCMTATVLAVTVASERLFGRGPRAWTALVAVTSGPVLALGHLAVYDVLALLGVAVSFWAVTELAARDSRVWLVVAALAYVVGVTSKYPALLFTILPLLSVLFVVRRRRAFLDAGLFAFIVGASLTVYFLLQREQIDQFAAFWSSRAGSYSGLGVPTEILVYSQIYFALVPTSLAIGGWFCLRGQRALATALLSGVVIWPLYHIGTGTAVSDYKHVLFGAVFAFPLGGVLLSRLWSSGLMKLVPPLIVAGVGAFGLVQMSRIDATWPNLESSIAFMDQHVVPGDRILANNAWPYVLPLYTAGEISSPFDVYDSFRLLDSPGGVVRPCEFDWFVEAPGSVPWPEKMRAAIDRCGTFSLVFSAETQVTGLGCNLRFFQYNAYTEVWRNTAIKAARDNTPVKVEPLATPDPVEGC